MKKYKTFYNTELIGDCVGCIPKENPDFGAIETVHNINSLMRVHQDFIVPIPGFMIIESVRHVQTEMELDDQEWDAYNRLRLDTRKALLSVLDIKEVIIHQEERSQHLHLWIFPIYDWMFDVIDVSDGRIRLEHMKVLMKYAEEKMLIPENIAKVEDAAHKLRDFFAKTSAIE